MPRGIQLNANALRVLAGLYHGTEPHYGLSLSRALGLGNGTLYPILDKLEGAGLIVGEWEAIDPHAAGRRPRRFYTLTGEGIRTFEAERARVFGPVGTEGRHA
ncbi:Transcriptional regulator PadR-like family protein [Deinococcus reticulitermitis]|uniref:Transcriptional regulator PadR-like family protein n=1 Tax=Deinococcus reticulitermitis TaxID=856736 RepID=A0A1H6ZGT7_9DEIO|nr:PadR family transcriptional regulator [Deinococcus reticulitermitis]SEJ51354.1 Transcriptional regulator PadR-like family protein [Deinococcus reticulitermitis]